jgi:hypothetical protein
VLDLVAIQDEYSHVDAATARRIGEVVVRRQKEPLVATAGRLVSELAADDLTAIVADWLKARVVI